MPLALPFLATHPGLVLPLHVTFGDMDAHTRILVYGLAFGPFVLLLAVTYVQLRRTRREEGRAGAGWYDVAAVEEDDDHDAAVTLPATKLWAPGVAGDDEEHHDPRHHGG